MFFFYIILIILFLLILFISFTTIQVHIQNIRYSTDKQEGRHLNKNYKIMIKLYLFEKINFFKLDITKSKIEREKVQKSINKIEKKMIRDSNNFDIKTLKALKYLNLELKKLNLNVIIGLQDAASCAICVGTISSLIAIILRNFLNQSNDNFWKVIPVYQNRNLLNVNLDCIFNLKLLHIIYTIYFLKKKGEKNGRTSNRRAYAHSNE